MRPIIGTPECTCGQHNCYPCRRYSIDQTAVKIYDREIRICHGMSGSNIEQHALRQATLYRDKAVNELAFEFAS